MGVAGVFKKMYTYARRTNTPDQPVNSVLQKYRGTQKKPNVMITGRLGLRTIGVVFGRILCRPRLYERSTSGRATFFFL